MCELLGMSSNHRTSINLSLTTLAKRGENPRLHGDGWGVAFYEGNDVRLIKDSGEAKDSDWVTFIKKQEIYSHDVIAHIRKSTVGEVSYRNTHPFVRELGGRMHTFAHNGTFVNIHNLTRYHSKVYRPVGTTDSELAFCFLMERMQHIWKDRLPTVKQKVEVLKEFAGEMCSLGPTNFLYSDGESLFAHGHRRHDPIADKTVWPGLNYIQLDCRPGESGFEKSYKTGIAMEADGHKITLFASVPLNEGDWKPLAEGELISVTKGRIQHFS